MKSKQVVKQKEEEVEEEVENEEEMDMQEEAVEEVEQKAKEKFKKDEKEERKEVQVSDKFELCLDRKNLDAFLQATEMLEEIVVKLGNDGISACQMEPSQIAMVKVSIPKSAFKTYTLEKELEICFDRDKLATLAKFFKESIVLKNEKGLVISDERNRKSFTIPLLENENYVNKEPKLEFDYEVNIESKELKQVVKEASMMSSSLGFKLSNGALWVECEGYRNMPTCQVVPNLQREAKEGKSVYAIPYLENISYGVGKLYLRANSPLKATGKVENCEIVYYLAPRIENI